MTQQPSHQNLVSLTGRVSGPPEQRTLPSGDEIVTFRLVVRRDPPRAGARARSRQTVDTIECVAWTSRLRRTVSRLEDGATVAVTGCLRRRFSRAAGGGQSWYAVELASCSAVAAAQ
ncbi:single-stranded DNA-binding protein [Aeromicrobium sp. CnD17-E]|uniref:single-stranded DNA-binding protein n=1 Tax=Aeromicrobium sp. CnD17-E TaxID=2954487 RepID=UPI00209845A6|nr:single-stranded DNA-binding protein [Aeromicrobium sp. CnD17-E]MCO7238434.1 single-stranded DNA-binding protein [Aeromicrobium sp. CnD17-E]